MDIFKAIIVDEDEKLLQLAEKGRKWAANLKFKSKKDIDERFVTCGLYAHKKNIKTTKSGKRLNDGLRAFYFGAFDELGNRRNNKN